MLRLFYINFLFSLHKARPWGGGGGGTGLFRINTCPLPPRPRCGFAPPAPDQPPRSPPLPHKYPGPLPHMPAARSLLPHAQWPGEVSPFSFAAWAPKRTRGREQPYQAENAPIPATNLYSRAPANTNDPITT